MTQQISPIYCLGNFAHLDQLQPIISFKITGINTENKITIAVIYKDLNETFELDNKLKH